MKFFKNLSVIAICSLLLTACVSTAQINQEAESNYAKVKQEARAKSMLDTSSTTAHRIHSVFNKMKLYAERANKTGVPFQWEIIVLKLSELNAWAMPGGKMAFYTGLVDKLNLSDDEIAVVMGHEMAHALQEHGKSDRTVSAVTGIVGVLADVAVTATTGVNTEGLLSTGVDLVANKPFSRSQETEADEVGLMLMAESGYNPEAAPNVWVKMSQANGSSGLSIFSTHPSNEDRQANLARLVPKAKEIYNRKK
ncbi:M48 family metalloprotease [Glaesserella parasuis]|uniref:M48 family metallopeptidase n=1 Tax=Glaesserella parasuis TaxID=738 RepID=UPI0002CADD03|nr:M48 family metallopeptidase [Glaesserella parasuis]EMY46763.1 Zn-dependent protease with chaperone function [Glaesserella parasuis gx033]MDG6247474.1 M48 family metallopeptidase [Glaesserella parasuis]MDG6456050.1 M48 family metallopeptidase [Glaesserella parasuis]MDG6788460.1 M48 family metallopeptidase [Glaesserella parasuis]MDG6806114.1 M48 family metallopeptidase [Glaesserella parasuis]